jgi:hypothetical protein
VLKFLNVRANWSGAYLEKFKAAETWRVFLIVCDFSATLGIFFKLTLFILVPAAQFSTGRKILILKTSLRNPSNKQRSEESFFAWHIGCSRDGVNIAATDGGVSRDKNHYAEDNLKRTEPTLDKSI